MGRRLLVLLVPLLLAGCSSEPEPVVADPTPAVTSSPTPVESSSAAAPETAEAFIKRWLSASVDMQNAGDSSSYRAMAPVCKPCIDLADRVDSYYEAGGFIRFLGQEATEISAVPSGSGTTALRVKIKTRATSYRVSADAPTSRIEGGDDVLEVVLERSSDDWTVKDFSRIAS